MNDRYKLIVFDWDGTLIDSINWIANCIQFAASECGFPPPELQAAKEVIGLSIENAILTLFPNLESKTRDQLIDAYQTAYKSQEISRDQFFDGVYEMLVSLKTSGYCLAVATGKTRSGLARALYSTRTENLFDITRCADETASKPSPQMLLEILNGCNVSRDQALMVGDTAFDLQMANNARMASVAVTCGAHPEHILKQHNPLMCLHQPTELLNFIK